MADELTPAEPETAPPVSEVSRKSDPYLDAAARAGAATSPTIIRRGGVGFFTALALSCLATAGGAGLALTLQSNPHMLTKIGLSGALGASAMDGVPPDLTSLTARVAALEAEMSGLRARGANGAAVPPPAPNASASSNAAVAALPPSGLVDLNPVTDEVKGIAGRVTAIETRLAALDPTGSGGAIIASLQAEIANLKVLVAALQQQAAAAPSPAITFAVVNLSEAANRPGPFVPEFETLRAALPNVPEVAALEAYARTGVATRALLAERFGALESALQVAAEAPKPRGSFVDWFTSLFSGMVKVKAKADANGSTPESALMRAKAKLDQGALVDAVVEVKTIANAPPAVTEWASEAQRRLDLESRLAAVRGAVERASRAPAPQLAAPLVGTVPAPPTRPSANPATTPSPVPGISKAQESRP